MAIDPNLTEQQKNEIEQQAREQGITAEELLKRIVGNFLENISAVTRFAAKKGPRK
ncbi:MAG: hypothetical protein IPM37_23205 [Hahellaceae bacterium]|nr:hypothetical protein [Hahellaceae bacterium]